jgi:hypothetical protein
MDTVTEAPAVPADRHDVGYPKPAPTVDLMPPAEPKPWEAIPEGDYAIVELMGHQTFVGLIAEVERFGTKMIAIKPLFGGQLLDEVYRGGSAIYGVTPCTREVAWNRMPKSEYQLPPSVRAALPAALLPAPEPERRTYSTYGADDDEC